MVASKTRILIIEDVPTDAELARRQIDRELGPCEYRVVDTREDFLKALESFDPELIVSDYMLPNFDGMRALKESVVRRPEIPFIILTGSMNEDTAIECMKTGAWDYIIKEHIKRLGQAVRNSLHEKKIRLEKMRIEDALYRAGKQWRATFDAMNDALFVTDTDGIIIRANDAFRLITGKPWPEIVGSACNDVISGGHAREALCPLVRKEMDVMLGKVWYRSVVDPVYDQEGKIVEVIHVMTDITERKAAEEALRDSETKLKAMFESTPMVLMVADRNLEVREMNPAGVSLCGRGPGSGEPLLIGQVLGCTKSENGNFDGCSSCVLRKTVLETISTGRKHRNVEISIFSKGPDSEDEEKIYFLHTTPVAISGEEQVLVILDEITEMKKAREMLAEQQRLQALGQVASGIAHDINNTLSPITLYTESLLETEKGLSERGRRFLKMIKTSIGDIESVTERMRAFYKTSGEEEKVFVRSADLFNDVGDLTMPRWKDIPNRLGITIQLKKDADPALPAFPGYESELRESLINLIFNAVDAMPEGGLITLKAFTAGGNMVLEVSDSGRGMSAEERQRCLDPFYTTKGTKGTGLGLPGVYGMAKRHGGTLEIVSVPGKGTSVKIVLPLSGSVAEESTALDEPNPTGSMRIMLIDDDERILDALREMLSADGYTVDAYGDSEKAVSAYSNEVSEGGGYDAVITDLGMPGIDGIEAARSIKNLTGDIPIILLTGWGKLMNPEELPDCIDEMLPKPVTMTSLRNALKRLAR